MDNTCGTCLWFYDVKRVCTHSLYQDRHKGTEDILPCWAPRHEQDLKPQLTCETCKWFERYENDTSFGICHADPALIGNMRRKRRACRHHKPNP